MLNVLGVALLTLTGRAQNEREKRCLRGRNHGNHADRNRESIDSEWLWQKFTRCLTAVKGTKQLRLDPSIYEAILKEKVVVGDVIYIENQTGAVKVCMYISMIVPHSYACWAFRRVRFFL